MSSHNITDLVCVVEHFRSEVSALLVIARVLIILWHISMLPSHYWSITCIHWIVGRLTIYCLVFAHFLHFLVVICISIFQGKFWVLLYSIRHLFWLEAYYIEFAVLFAINIPFIKSQTVVSVAR